MKKIFLAIISAVVVSSLLLSSTSKEANARKPYQKKFTEKYPDLNKKVDKKMGGVGCALCHGPKKDDPTKTDKKIRNHYGKAVLKALKKVTEKDPKKDGKDPWKNVKDAEKIQKALEGAEKEKTPDGKGTYGEKIKSGKLPTEK